MIRSIQLEFIEGRSAVLVWVGNRKLPCILFILTISENLHYSVVAEIDAVKEYPTWIRFLRSGLHTEADSASDASRCIWRRDLNVSVNLPRHTIQIIFCAHISANSFERRMLVPDVQSYVVLVALVTFDAVLQQSTIFVSVP